MMSRLSILLPALFFLNLACHNAQELAGSQSREATPLTLEGTVKYINLEGGFYGIIADNGGKYLPLNLDDAFRKDGLRVRFEATPLTDVATIYMWGTPVKLTSIPKR